MRILIVEDEPTLGRQLKSTLEQNGYAVDLSTDGEDGHFLGSTEDYDAVILDLGLPEIDGLTVLGMWRKEGRTFPVLVLTARDSWSDKVAGLDAGADDYLTKPFSLRELLARVRALLRHHERHAAVPDVVELGVARLDFNRRVIVRSGEEHTLSEKEFGMLRLLAAHPGETVTRERFLDVVWGYHAYPSTRTVDNFIAALRAKIEADPASPRHLVTVRGAGYRLDTATVPNDRP